MDLHRGGDIPDLGGFDALRDTLGERGYAEMKIAADRYMDECLASAETLYRNFRHAVTRPST